MIGQGQGVPAARRQDLDVVGRQRGGPLGVTADRVGGDFVGAF